MSKDVCDSYTVRTMQPQEVKETYRMIDKEGWNLTLDKFQVLYGSSPNSFFVAVAENGEVAGTMSLYPTFGGEYVLGNIVIKESHRYKGLGRRIMDDVFALYPSAVVSLTAVPGADQFYLNTGFKFTEPQQGHDIFHLVLDRDRLQKMASSTEDYVITSQYKDSSFDQVVVYDQEARGYDNKTYVAMQVQCFKVVTAMTSDKRLVGFGVAFIKREEIVLDGLYADSDSVALHLIVEILKQFPEKNIMKIQIPSSRLFLSELGEVRSSYKYHRYSRGTPTMSPLSKVYNVGDCDYTY